MWSTFARRLLRYGFVVSIIAYQVGPLVRLRPGLHTHLIHIAKFRLSVDNLSSAEVLEKLDEGQVDCNLAPMIESACVLLSYLADALHAINTVQPHSKLYTTYFSQRYVIKCHLYFFCQFNVSRKIAVRLAVLPCLRKALSLSHSPVTVEL